MSMGVFSSGAVFAGRYQIVRCIATGGMGAVYEALHLETDRRRALKVMHPHFVESAELRSRFRQEARVAARIESDHIVEVFDAGIDETTGMPFLVMELLRGEELAKRLERRPRLPHAEALLYLHQTAAVLEKTHRANIVHRDLKPENLFLCDRDEGLPRIKVLDFGIAKLLSEAGATGVKATRSLGTPLYMAPEQFRAGGAVSPATDLFALGMIAYTVLVGVPYWIEEGNMVDNVYAFAATAACGPLEAATARARRQGVELPAAFDAWFARATSLAPGDRFPSALASVYALSEVLGAALPGGREQSSPHGLPAPQFASYPSLAGTPAPRFTPPVAPPVAPPIAPPVVPPTAASSMPVSPPPRASVPSAPQFGVRAPRLEATTPLPEAIGRRPFPSAPEGAMAQSAAHVTAPLPAMGMGPAREPQGSSPMMRFSTPVASSVTSPPQATRRTPLFLAGAVGLVLLVGGGIAVVTRASHKDLSDAEGSAAAVAPAGASDATAAPSPAAQLTSPPTVTPAATPSPDAAAPAIVASTSASKPRSLEAPSTARPATAATTATAATATTAATTTRPKTEKKPSIYVRD
jgi:eukaryotic-like serine/threonine-protein kinase